MLEAQEKQKKKKFILTTTAISAVVFMFIGLVLSILNVTSLLPKSNHWLQIVIIFAGFLLMAVGILLAGLRKVSGYTLWSKLTQMKIPFLGYQIFFLIGLVFFIFYISVSFISGEDNTVQKWAWAGSIFNFLSFALGLFQIIPSQSSKEEIKRETLPDSGEQNDQQVPPINTVPPTGRSIHNLRDKIPTGREVNAFDEAEADTIYAELVRSTVRTSSLLLYGNDKKDLKNVAALVVAKAAKERKERKELFEKEELWITIEDDSTFDDLLFSLDHDQNSYYGLSVSELSDMSLGDRRRKLTEILDAPIKSRFVVIYHLERWLKTRKQEMIEFLIRLNEYNHRCRLLILYEGMFLHDLNMLEGHDVDNLYDPGCLNRRKIYSQRVISTQRIKKEEKLERAYNNLQGTYRHVLEAFFFHCRCHCRFVPITIIGKDFPYSNQELKAICDFLVEEDFICRKRGLGYFYQINRSFENYMEHTSMKDNNSDKQILLQAKNRKIAEKYEKEMAQGMRGDSELDMAIICVFHMHEAGSMREAYQFAKTHDLFKRYEESARWNDVFELCLYLRPSEVWSPDRRDSNLIKGWEDKALQHNGHKSTKTF